MNPLDRPELRARALLRKLNIRSACDLHDMELIACACGAIVINRRMAGAEARIVHAGKKAVIAISDQVTGARRRFDIAHELGHFMLHKDEGITLCTNDDLRIWLGSLEKRREAEANSFAAAFLLPTDLISDQCENIQPSFEVISDLAAQFDTSLTATALRFASLSEEPVAIVSSTDGFVKWCKPSPEFAEFLQDTGINLPIKAELKSGTLARSFFKGISIPEKPQRVRASAWLEGNLLNPAAYLIENTIAMPRYKSTLSLLWLNEDIELDSDPSEEDDDGFVHSWMRGREW
jgi:Zn-dependent peptidase ImmA (M78 family)